MMGWNSDSVFWASRTARWSWTNSGSAKRDLTSSYFRRISSSFSSMCSLQPSAPSCRPDWVWTLGRYRAADGKGSERGGRMPLGRGAGGLLLVALAEPFDAAGRVDQLLLAGEEGVALAADLDSQLFLGRGGGPGLPPGPVDQDFMQIGVEGWFHG